MKTISAAQLHKFSVESLVSSGQDFSCIYKYYFRICSAVSTWLRKGAGGRKKWRNAFKENNNDNNNNNNNVSGDMKISAKTSGTLGWLFFFS